MSKNIIYLTLFLVLLSSCGSGENTNVTTVDIATVANAGADFSIDEQTVVTLDVADLDADPSIASYEWVQLSGTNIVFDESTPGIITFVSPTVTTSEVLIFSLTVTDNQGSVTSDQISVTINPVNADPIADAGEGISVNEQVSVTLEGAGVDSDGSISSYEWTQVSTGAVVTLVNSTSASMSFTAPTLVASETLTFSLTVTDNEGATNSDQVGVVVNPVNVDPVADAGEGISVSEQVLVTLEGTGVDSDGSISSYEWTQVSSGAVVTLVNSTSASMSFTAPTLVASETLTFSLTVTDNEGATDSDQVEVVVNATNDAPVANTLDLSVPVSQFELLSSLSASDQDGDAVIYTIESAPVLGTVTLINPATGEFRYTPSGETGVDQFLFSASDSVLSSNVATVSITVDPVDIVETGSNDDLASADTIYQNSTITGSLSAANDTDWFQFEAFETGSIAIDFDAPTSSTDEFFEIIITDSVGDELVRVQSGEDIILYASVIAGESYYVQLISATNFTSESYILGFENFISDQAILSWSAPTQNTDGSDLIDLASYVIYYGISGGGLNETVEVLDPNLETYTIKHFRIENLTYDFAMTTKNSLNIESVISEVVSKTF